MGQNFQQGCVIIGADSPIVIPVGQAFTWIHNQGKIPLKIEVFEFFSRGIQPFGVEIGDFADENEIDIINQAGGGDISVYLIITWAFFSPGVCGSFPPSIGIVS